MHPWTEKLPDLEQAVVEAVKLWIRETAPNLAARSRDVATLEISLMPSSGYQHQIDFSTKSAVTRYRMHEAKLQPPVPPVKREAL